MSPEKQFLGSLVPGHSTFHSVKEFDLTKAAIPQFLKLAAVGLLDIGGKLGSGLLLFQGRSSDSFNLYLATSIAAKISQLSFFPSRPKPNQ